MRATYLFTVLSTFFFLVIVYCYRKKFINNKHAYKWIIVSVLLLLSGIILPTKEFYKFSLQLGIHNPTVTLTFFGFFLLIFLSVAQSIFLTKHESNILNLTQELALATASIEKLKNSN